MNLSKFSGGGKKAICDAIKIAESLGHNYVGTEHILCAIFDVNCYLCEKLNKHGAVKGDIIQKTIEVSGCHIPTQLTFNDYSPRCKAVLERASNLRKYQTRVSLKDILKAIIEDPDCYAFLLMQETEVDVTSLYADLRHIATENQTENEVEETKMEIRTKRIVELWARRIKDKIEIQHTKELCEILDGDENYAKLKRIASEIESMCDSTLSYKISISVDSIVAGTPINKRCLLQPESLDRQAEAYEQYGTLVDELTSKKTELEAMLSACETYEQEMEVLKKRGIVDDNYNLAV